MSTICLVDGCGESAHAKGCCRRHYNRWRRKAEEVRSKERTYDRSFKRRYAQAKRRAATRGLLFELDFAEYIAIADRACFYCGERRETSGSGLDRIDNTLGYMPGNVLACCGACNTLRSDNLSVQETIALVGALQALRRAQAWRKADV